MFKGINITSAIYAGLPADVQALYVADNAGGYKLPLSEEDDPAALRRARDREKQDAADLRTANAALTTERDTLKVKVDASKTPQDVQTLEASWRTKVNEEKDKGDAAIAGLKKRLEDIFLDKAAAEISAVFLDPAIHQATIRGRLAVQFDENNTPTVRIKDTNGVVIAGTADDLKKEFQKDTAYAKYVVADSQANGGGAAGGSKGTEGGGAANGPITEDNFHEVSLQAKDALYKNNPGEFQRIADANRKKRFDASVHGNKK